MYFYVIYDYSTVVVYKYVKIGGIVMGNLTMSNADYARNASGARKLEIELRSDINKAHKALSKSDKAYTELVNTIRTYWRGSDANQFLKLLEDQRASIQGKIKKFDTIVSNALSADRQSFEKTQSANASRIQSGN